MKKIATLVVATLIASPFAFAEDAAMPAGAEQLASTSTTAPMDAASAPADASKDAAAPTEKKAVKKHHAKKHHHKAKKAAAPAKEDAAKTSMNSTDATTAVQENVNPEAAPATTN